MTTIAVGDETLLWEAENAADRELDRLTIRFLRTGMTVETYRRQREILVQKRKLVVAENTSRKDDER